MGGGGRCVHNALFKQHFGVFLSIQQLIHNVNIHMESYTEVIDCLATQRTKTRL